MGEGRAAASLTWLGHATVLVEIDGVRLLTDPVLEARVAHLRRAWAPDADALRDLDAVLVSHVHLDHLDRRSLRRIEGRPSLVVPHGAARQLRRWRVEGVQELAEGGSLTFGSVSVRAVPAQHPARRLPFARHAASVGFVVEGSRSVYFAGDTDLFEGMEAIRPGLDVALVPIWGWGPTLGPGHLDPVRAAEALARLRPRLGVPIHWGTYFPMPFTRAAKFLRAPVRAFEQAAARKAPDVAVRVLGPNERLELS